MSRNSHQAANAGTWLHLQVDIPMHEIRLPERGPSRILRLISYDNRHDCTYYGATILCLRIYIAIYQSVQETQPLDAHDCGGLGWGFCGRTDNPTGRDQDAPPNERHCQRSRAQECEGNIGCGEHHQKTERLWGVFPWSSAEDHYRRT